MNAADEIHVGVFGRQSQVGRHRLPMLVEEIISEARLLVEEDHGE